MKDIEKVKEMLSITETESKNAVPFDPASQVQEALASFLQSRLKKLEEDREFEEEIRNSISARISEAKFSELIHLLDVYQINNNTSVEKVLSPFIPRAGERIPVLDEGKKKKGADAGELSKEMSGDLMKAFQVLSSTLETMQQAAKPDPKIKDAIAESLE